MGHKPSRKIVLTSNKNGIYMGGRVLILIAITLRMESYRLLHFQSIRDYEPDFGEGGKAC